MVVSRLRCQEYCGKSDFRSAIPCRRRCMTFPIRRLITFDFIGFRLVWLTGFGWYFNKTHMPLKLNTHVISRKSLHFSIPILWIFDKRLKNIQKERGRRNRCQPLSCKILSLSVLLFTFVLGQYVSRIRQPRPVRTGRSLAPSGASHRGWPATAQSPGFSALQLPSLHFCGLQTAGPKSQG